MILNTYYWSEGPSDTITAISSIPHAWYASGIDMDYLNRLQIRCWTGGPLTWLPRLTANGLEPSEEALCRYGFGKQFRKSGLIFSLDLRCFTSASSGEGRNACLSFTEKTDMWKCPHVIYEDITHIATSRCINRWGATHWLQKWFVMGNCRILIVDTLKLILVLTNSLCD